MAETTLGQRVMDVAMAAARAAIDRGEPGHGATWLALRALAARADAAERLATAAASYHAPTSPRSPADASTDAAGLVAALDAWQEVADG